MKKLLFLLMSSFIFSQSNYQNGFNKGFKEGYCYGEITGCISPVPPIAPIDIKNDFTTGYNNGFTLGKNEKNNSYQPTGGIK